LIKASERLPGFDPEPIQPLKEGGESLKTAKAISLVAAASLVYCALCWGITIAVTGSWSETIDASDLAAGAGSDLLSTYESPVDAMSIDISATAGNWGLDVKRIDSNWHGSLYLYAQRTSDGTGSGTITGGESYTEVTTTDQSFFSGNDDRSNVTVQLKLTGVSIQVPIDVYTTSIYYTVTDQ